MLEEFGRDSPAVTDRDDLEAKAMVAKVDAKQVSDAIAAIKKE